MKIILRSSAAALAGMLALTACTPAAQTNDTANATAAATNQAARESADEMHNQMTTDGMADDQHRGRQGMDGMQGMPDKGNMRGGTMNKAQDAPMNNSMPMQDDSNHM